MLVGEQPGDQEDLRGEVFVGPAGRVLDDALAQAGIERATVYLTNAVKHFRWKPAPRGKRRLHQRPNRTETVACRPWTLAEAEVVRPRLILCLGALAAESLIPVPTGELRPTVARSPRPWLGRRPWPRTIRRLSSGPRTRSAGDSFSPIWLPTSDWPMSRAGNSAEVQARWNLGRQINTNDLTRRDRALKPTAAGATVLYIGTSGWQYRDWRGPLLPGCGLPTPDWLPYYATAFPVVEVNSTFYSLPAPSTVTRWADQTAPDFRFAVKLSRYLTHIRRLRQPREPVSRFFERLGGLGPEASVRSWSSSLRP